jgi:hypothetical protein
VEDVAICSPRIFDLPRQRFAIKSVRQQPYLARYALNWGTMGDFGYVASSDTSPIGAAWLRLWLGEDKGFGYVIPI